MKIVKTTLLTLMCVIFSMSAFSQEKTTEAPAGMPDMEAYMKAYMEKIKPTEHHQHLLKSVGTWKALVKTWMAPDQPPQESEGKAVIRPILDGRYTLMEYEGKMGEIPFKGLSLSTYDPIKKAYVALWVDSLSSWFAVAEGQCDGTGKKTVYHMTYTDPVLEKPIPVREVYEFIDDDHIRFEYFENRDGQEFKVMEILYTRVKSEQ